jgi:hypothetical protein
MAREMARRIAVGCASTALIALALVPAGAADSRTGTIVAPTAGSPAVPRLAYVLHKDNVGDQPTKTYALGYVTRVPANVSHFRVAPALAGSLSDFDIFFYTGTDADYPEAALPDETTADRWAGDGPKCDALPAGAKWAIVTLSAGAADQFTLTFSNTAIGPAPSC